MRLYNKNSAAKYDLHCFCNINIIKGGFVIIIDSGECKYSYAKTPNLPQNKVAYVFLGKNNVPLLEKSLKERNINICSLEGDTRLDERVSYHTDMLVFHAGSNRIIFSKKQAEFPFEDAEITVSSSKIAKNYPYDVALNAVMVGNNLICNKKYTDKSILEYARIQKMSVINVKQGYSKCSVVPISHNAIITDDRGIAQSARDAGIDALYIDKRFVICEGFDYGFIGGASGMIAKNVLAFTGIFTDEHTKNVVETFLSKYGVRADYLTDKPMFDVGSIIPILEYSEGNIDI